MARTKFSGDVAKNILLALAVIPAIVGATILFAAAPGLGVVTKQLVDWYKKQNYSRKQRVRKTFIQLQKARLIEEKVLSDGSTQMILSEKGKKKILRYKLDDLRLNQPQKWDKKWRMVIFDIPKKFHKEREVWRYKLKTLGFYQLQKSIWVFPHPCREEVDFVAEYLGISPYVRQVEANSIDGTEELIDYFFSA